MSKPFVYQPKSQKSLIADYKRREKNNKNGFSSQSDFLEWYSDQNKACFYCGLKESECQEIVMTGLLVSKRFPNNGEIKQGRARGVWLEVDRLEPTGLYSRKNCVLACYFCNNDKSDVFTASQYKLFASNRVVYIRSLLKKQK